MPMLAMKRKRDDTTPIKKEKDVIRIKTETSLSIPDGIKNNPVQLEEYIKQFCEIESVKIQKIETQILENFRKVCGLTPENWNHFAKEILKIKSYDRRFFSLPPQNFKQHMTSLIPEEVIKRLENNMRRNNICFEKLNIYDSREDDVGSAIKTFSINTPFYRPKDNHDTRLIFRPNKLVINYDNYKKNQDFLNVCIVAAFTQEITRIRHFFSLSFQYQMGEALSRAARDLIFFNINMFSQKYLSIEKELDLFVRDYGFKVGILYLTLKNSEIAQLINHYLRNNPSLCQDYGLSKDDNQSFFQQMEEIDSLKNNLRKTEEEKCTEFMNECGLDPDVFS